AAGPQAYEEDGGFGVSLEAVDQSLSLRGRSGEHVDPATALLQYVTEEVDHLDELGEDQRLLAGLLNLLDELNERLELPGTSPQAVRVARNERWMAADLLQFGDRRQRVHRCGTPFTDLLNGGSALCGQDVAIEGDLLVCQLAVAGNLNLVRQLGCDIALATAEYEWSDA